MNQIIMILLISVLVLVHEMGHFFAAKMCKIAVSRFGIGMPIGPTWKLFKWGETTFYIHAFLFGGYVAFLDDEENFEKNEKKDKEEEKEEEKEEIDPTKLYENKTIGQKLFVVSAGVFMNIVFAIILVIFCAMYFHKLPTATQNLYVNSFVEKAISNAEKMGIKVDDKILKVNSCDINSLYGLTFFAKSSKLFDNYADDDLIKQNLVQLKKLNPAIKDTINKGQTVILPKTMTEKAVQVDPKVLKGLEKYKKDGIKLSDKQISLRDKVYSKKTYKTEQELSINDLAYALSDTYKPVSITVLRNGKELTFNNIKVDNSGMFGMGLKIQDIYVATTTPKAIIVGSFDYLWTTTTTMLIGLKQLIVGKVSATDMHGVIAVVKVGGDIIAQKGFLNGILLTAMISINLAIMNFLPIPALDGGHVMFLVIEKLTGKKPSKEFGEKINNFFFMLLIILMVAICYNDIFALVTKKF